MPWHVAHAATKICSPLAFAGSAPSDGEDACAAKVGGACALSAEISTHTRKGSVRRETTAERYQQR